MAGDPRRSRPPPPPPSAAAPPPVAPPPPPPPSLPPQYPGVATQGSAPAYAVAPGALPAYAPAPGAQPTYAAAVPPYVYPYPPAYPQAYPYPYAYGAPGYYPYPIIVIQPPKEDTKKGVRQLSTAMFLYLIAQCMLFALSVILYVALLPALVGGGAQNIGAFIGVLLVLIIMLIVLAILILVALILGLLGLLKLRKGMEEFGPEQRAAVESATLFVVLGIVASIGGSILSFMIGASGPVSLGWEIVASAIAGVVSATLFGLGLVRLVEKLSDAGEKKNLWIFFYFTLGGSIAGAVIAFAWVVVAMPSLQQGNLSALGSAGWLGISSIAIVIGYFFGWQAYSSIAKKLESGKLVPGMPLPTGLAVARPGSATGVSPAASFSSSKPK